ncbi:acetoacetate decarboxylase (ADC) [Janthinobacterium sp. FW305-129]|uniref:acetoacetate decarboxylase (ADC) n=1 Tax=Janthinobacterium sp. FW305-129 TaxID=2775054 RepID=UPI001E5F66D9|nr:acetoacetate decarboxylase (ADC) [Janthinobacterium sp. FW305-129]MCC7596127.1 acetoacetate decarboxylase (ADC) [Janthinobacterium sp. FW305-129]
MKIAAAVSALLWSTAAAPSWADNPAENKQVLIDIAGHDVPVAAGGLYDRFRSNPPLSVIAAEAPELDLSWFKGIQKEKVAIGFESYSPNFYYKNSKITAVFTADLARLKELMPEDILREVQPLQVWPGRGAVALTAYAYEYCDNDSYNEISLAIVTNKPGTTSFGPFTLLGQSLSNDFWGYVLKLPVNTELARVRGVVGYNLPKWLTGIERKETEGHVAFEVMDSATGKLDFVFAGKKLGGLSNQAELVTNSFTNKDGAGKLTYGYAVSRQLSHASSTSAEAVDLKLGDGSFSSYIKSLKLGKLMKYEYVPEFQGALYAPKPLIGQ